MPYPTDDRSEERLPIAAAGGVDIYLLSNSLDMQLLLGRSENEITNVSKHGLMLRSLRPLQKHEQFRLRYDFEAGYELTLYGTVCWVTKTPRSDYIMGLKLEDKLGTDYLLWQNRLSRLLLEQLNSEAETTQRLLA